MNPKVSIIMPIYNAERFVRKAIDSILHQTYENFELILINDWPTDSTMDIVNTYQDKRIRIIHNEKNSGIAFSRNVGLDNSTGKYIAIMDDDDISMPNRLELGVRFLEDREDIDILGGGCEYIDEDDNSIRQTTVVLNNPKYIRANYLFRNIFHNGTVILRKSLIDKYQLHYKDNCLGMEDYLFWIECSKVGEMSGISDIVLRYRDRKDNESSRVLKEKSEERKKLYAEFRKYSLSRSGFQLPEDMLNIINKAMAEFDGKCDTVEEALLFQKALNEIILQAKSMKLNYTEELLILSKKLFHEKLYKVNGFWADLS